MVNSFDCLAVKITLLGLINDILEQPRANTSNQNEDTDHRRTIALRHEIAVAQQLAFICANSDDPLHVMAVCIEEATADGCLIIRFAANTGKHKALIEGLKKISQILQNEAISVNHSMNRQELFSSVVSLNRLRILSRIRSRHAPSWRARNKTPLLRRLRTAKELLLNPSVDGDRSRNLVSSIQNIERQLNCLENMETTEARSSKSDKLLLELVETVHSILPQYEQDLELIPDTPGFWNTTATESLLDRLRKLGQYCKACEELLRASRRYRIFANITIDFVDLQQGGKRLSVDAAERPDAIINACCAKETLPKLAARSGKSIFDVRETIKKRLREDSRLHAEIQLVLYYEQKTSLVRPRVISSSKSACYLCHLLLNLHGQYFTPSTHGKLYDSWKWPTPQQISNHTQPHGTNLSLQHLLPEFGKAIDRKIRGCLNDAKPKRRVDPLESRVDLLATMTPSLLSHLSRWSRSALSNITHRQDHVDTVPADIGDHDDTSSSASVKTVKGLKLPYSRSPAQADVPSSLTVPAERYISHDKTSIPDIAGSSSRSCTASPVVEGSNPGVHSESGDSGSRRKTRKKPLHLQQGEVAVYSLHDSLQVYVPGLHVSLQYDEEPNAQAIRLIEDLQSQKKPLHMEIECLASSARFSNVAVAAAVDLDESDWIEKSPPEGVLFSQDGLVLKRHSTLLKLRARPS